jgi:PA domain
VICASGSTDPVEKGEAVLRAGGAGMILINRASWGKEFKLVNPHVLPATDITYSDGQILTSYLEQNRFVPIMCITCQKICVGNFRKA